jgi:Fe-S cluster assembly ATP-binding protein
MNEILKFELKVNRGEIHAIMGPNGSGKVLFKSSCRSPSLFYLKRYLFFKGVLDLDPEERSHLGIFLAFNIRSRFQELVMKIFYVSHNSKQNFITSLKLIQSSS